MLALSIPSSVAQAASEADELCLGDPCVIVGSHAIDPFSFLDFADRAVHLQGVLQIGAGSVTLVAGSLRIAASGSIAGGDASTPGGTLDVDVAGDVILEGSLGAGIDLRGAPGGALTVNAGGSIASTRPLGAAGGEGRNASRVSASAIKTT